MPERLLKALCLCYLLCMFIGSFLWIAMLRSGILDGLTLGPLPLGTAKEYQYYALSGTIGGSLYALRLFYWHNIRQKLYIHKWWIWYFLRPILSGGTAALMMLMVQVGNSLVALISLAFLMGYGFGKVMDKLDGLTDTFVNGQTVVHESQTGQGPQAAQTAQAAEACSPPYAPHAPHAPQAPRSPHATMPQMSDHPHVVSTTPLPHTAQPVCAPPVSHNPQACAPPVPHSNGSKNPDQPIEQLKS